MTGAGIRISVEGEAAIEARLSLLAARFGDLTPLMEIIGMTLEVDAHDNFEGEHSPAGVPWPKSQRAIRDGGKTLQDTRRLFKSISYRADARSVEVGTNVIYGARHQYGFSGTERVASHKRTMRQVFGMRLASPIEVTVGAFDRKVNTPARPFLGMSADARADIMDAVESYVGGGA
jgi:phage virion morphogenesis protein